MALRLSTGLRNAILDTKAAATNLAVISDAVFVDGGSGNDSITSLLTDLSVYVANSKITIASASTSANDGTYDVISSTANEIVVATGSFTTDAENSCLLASALGGSFVDLFRNCVIDIYSGTQPTTANSGETGTLLLTFTQDSLAFVAGENKNGLNFGAVASGILTKAPGEIWSGEGVAAGTAGWFRCYDNAYVTGASTSEVRFDGACATSGSQLNMSNTAITIGGTTTIDALTLTLPAN